MRIFLNETMWCSIVTPYIVFLLLPKSNGKSYRDYLLVHGIPKNKHELKFFQEIHVFYNATFWRKPGLVDRPVQFSLSREAFAELTRDTKDTAIVFFVLVRDLQSVFDSQTIKPYIRRQMDSFNWKNYYSVEDMYYWLRDLSERHPRDVSLQNIGQSVQGRHILAVTVYLHGSGVRSRTPKVIIEGGCHAREWISPAFVTYMINVIVNAKNSTDKHLMALAHSYEWIFIPLLNPDGYSHSQIKDRLWRKNLHGEWGVDLNRNFGLAFGKVGVSENKNDEEYSGKSAFSEPESMAIAEFVKANSINLKYYISFHSYGQYIIIPYTFSKDQLDNYKEVQRLANKVARRSKDQHLTEYSVGTAYETVGYLASGTSIDWVKKACNVPFVVTIELPDKGNFGFALPKDQILPVCEKTMDSIKEMFDTEAYDIELKYHIPDSGESSRRNQIFYDYCVLYCFTVYFMFI